MLYVDDLVDFVGCAIHNQTAPYVLYNCGYGDVIQIKDLVSKIVRSSKKNLAIEHDLSQPTINTRLFLDCTKAERELGWTRRTSLDDGIDKAIAWWGANIGAPVA